MPGCLSAGVFSLLPGQADDRTRRRSGLLEVAKKRRSEERFDSKGSGPSQTLFVFVFGRFPAGTAGGVSGWRIASSDPERANEKTLSGHGDMGRRVDGKSTVPPFRTTALDSAKRADPLEYAVMYRKTTVSDMAVRLAAYRRIGSPRICVRENRDRGGRLFYPSEETVGSRDGMSLHASLPAARWRDGGQSGAIRPADNGTAGAFPNLSESAPAVRLRCGPGPRKRSFCEPDPCYFSFTQRTLAPNWRPPVL